jgi:hypothetical protein
MAFVAKDAVDPDQRLDPTRNSVKQDGRAADHATLERQTPAQRVAQLERLERRGLATREIAAELGLARATVSIYPRIPMESGNGNADSATRGLRQLGRPITGSGRLKRAPERCRSCAAERRAGASSGCWRSATGPS